MKAKILLLLAIPFLFHNHLWAREIANSFDLSISSDIGESIQCNEPIAISSITINQPVCNGDSGDFYVNVSGNTDGVMYSIGGEFYQSSNAFLLYTPGSYLVYVKNQYGCIASQEVTLIEPLAMDIEATVTEQFNCDGNVSANVELLVTNGQAPYGYRMNNNGFQSKPSFNNLAPGIYNFTVLDSKGCVTYTSITIEGYTPMQGSFFVNKQPICHGDQSGEIVGVVNGGRAPFTYELNGITKDSGVFSNLGIGAYTMTITDATGCSITSPGMVIAEPNPLAISATLINNITCDFDTSGVISASASGGIPPFMYSLDGNKFRSSNTFTGLGEGSYQVYVKDAKGCIAQSQGISIFMESNLSIGVHKEDISCYGANDGKIQIFASGGVPPYSYSSTRVGPWSDDNVMEDLNPGVHYIFVQEATGCVHTFGLVEINEPSRLVLTSSHENTSGRDGSITVNATGGTPPYQYRYYKDGVLGATNTIGNKFNWLEEGIYQVFVIDANNCWDGDTVYMESTVGIINTNTSISLYPNPSNGLITIAQEGDVRYSQIMVYNQIGELNYSFNNISTEKTTIDLSNLPSGIYHIKLSNDYEVKHIPLIME